MLARPSRVRARFSRTSRHAEGSAGLLPSPALGARTAIAASRGGSRCLVKSRSQFLNFPLELGVVLAQVGNGVAQRGLRLLDFGGGLPLPQDAAGMIETQAGDLRQRCSPSLDRWQVVYHLDQATPIALVDVIEMMTGEPTAQLGIVATADRLLGSAAAIASWRPIKSAAPIAIQSFHVASPLCMCRCQLSCPCLICVSRSFCWPRVSPACRRSFISRAKSSSVLRWFVISPPGRSRLDYPTDE